MSPTPFAGAQQEESYVRRGLDYGRQGFSRWDLTREVIKAIGTGSDRR